MSYRRASTGLFVIAIALGVLALQMFRVVETKRSHDRTVGMTIDTGFEGPGLEIADVREGLPADRAGLHAGDVIVGVNDRPVVDEADYDAEARFFRSGQEQVYEIEREGRRETVAVRPGIAFPWLRFAADFAVLLAYLGIGLLSLRHYEDIRARLLFFFTTAVALEFVLPGYVVGRPVLNVVTSNAFYLLSGLQMALELHLASVIPDRRGWLERHPWLVKLYYAVGLGFGILVSLTFTAEILERSWLPWSLELAERALNDVGMPIWALAVTGILAWPAWRHPERQKRLQSGFVLFGVLPWTVLVLISTSANLLGRTLPSWTEMVWSFGFLVYPVAVFVAMFRYQLFDMELVVRRSLVYTALTTILLLVFYAALGAGGVLASEFVEGGASSVWVVAAATLILGLLFTPLRRWLETAIYKRFFPERLELRQKLTALAGELPAFGKLPLMGDHLVERLGDILAVRWTSLLLADPKTGLLGTLASTLPAHDALDHALLLSPDDPGLRLLTASGRPFPARQLAAKSAALRQRLEMMRAELVVPLIAHDRLVGLLLLGPKESGDHYPAEEMELLTLMAHHAATVFENARLFESATRDSLTGLWRREAVLEQLENELHRARRYGRPLSIGMADIDHFKAVNDRYGHLTGDSMLKRVGSLLATGLRSTDFVGRYGGEEFLFVLPETDLEGAVRVAEKVRQLVEEDHLLTDEGRRLTVTLSIGLASLERLADTDVKGLLAIADRSLYLAKEEGRNRVRPTVA